MPTGPATILIADDQAHITHILALKFRALGHRVLITHDGEEALDTIRQTRPDLIITDCQMPYLSGYDMACQLFADPATAPIPVIMLTARGHTLSRDDLARTGIVHLIGKPFSIAALAEQAQTILAAPRPTPRAAG